MDWTVAVGKDRTSAIYEPAIGAQSAVFVCAHGAGGNKNDRAVVGAANALRSIGLGVVRFNFLYKERAPAVRIACPG